MKKPNLLFISTGTVKLSWQVMGFPFRFGYRLGYPDLPSLVKVLQFTEMILRYLWVTEYVAVRRLPLWFFLGGICEHPIVARVIPVRGSTSFVACTAQML